MKPMLGAIRSFAKSPAASLLIAVLVVSFSVWGVRDVLHPKFTDAVVTAGAHEESPGEFKRDFDNARQQASQQAGQELSAQDAVAAGLDQRVLTEVESNQAYAEYLSRIGITPAPELVAKRLQAEPAFFNDLGQFDKATYQQKLAGVGLTPAQFEGLMTDDIASNQLAAGLATGLKTPQIYGALIANYEFDSRGFSYFVLGPQSIPALPQPTDAQLQALINQHADEMRRPEMRTLSLVRFSAKALAPTMPADEAKVQQLYQFRKDSLSQPEKRSVIELTAKDAATAAAVAAKLKSGVAPADIAKLPGAAQVTYDDKPKSDLADPAVAAAAFSAQSGEVVGPITSGLAGYAVIKVTKITPANIPTLDSLRPQLEADAKTDDAVQKVFDSVKKYQAARDSGASIADAAKASGATPASFGPLTAQGQDIAGQPIKDVDQKMLKTAFSLPSGGESEIQDEGNGEYYAVKVDKIAPPALPTVAELRPQLTQFYMQQAINDALTKKAADIVKAVQGGQTMETAAAAAKTKVAVVPTISRGALDQGHQIDAGMVEKLFGAKKGEIVSGPVGQVQVMIARIDAVQPANTDQAAHGAARESANLAKGIFEDMGEAARTTATSAIKPEGDLNAARTAIGVTADQLPKGTAKPKTGPAL